MKFFDFKILVLLFAFVFTGCNTDNDNSPENVSIIGKWQLYGSTQYYGLKGIEFTNYGVAIVSRTPYMASRLDYDYNGTSLTISGVNGTGIFSDGGNTLKISGFADPSSFGAEGVTAPCINGTYIRQE